MKLVITPITLLLTITLTGELEAFAMKLGFNIHQGLTADALYPRSDAKKPRFYIDLKNGSEASFSQEVISYIAYENAQTDFIQNAGGRQPAELHFDDEAFYSSSLRLKNLKAEIIAIMTDEIFLDLSIDAQLEREVRVKKARKLLGQALHTLQDFYSHTNWVERGLVQENLTINTALGDSVFPRPPGNAQCNGDKPGFSAFTSGYWFEEDWCTAPPNKCAHGRPLPAACSPFGLNKDVPTRPNHGTAVQLAKDHTRSFVEEILQAIRGNTPVEDSRMDVAACQFMGVSDFVKTCSNYEFVTVEKIDETTQLVTSDGSVVSDPPGIECGETCIFEFPYGAPVTVTAGNSGGLSFVRWSNSSDVCKGSSEKNCIFVLDGNKTAKAVFEEDGLTLTGAWFVTENVDGTDCGDGVYTTSYPATVTQTGNAVTFCAGPVCLEGSISGNSLQLSGSYPDDGGITSANVNATVAEDFNSLSGSSNWSWSNGQFSCSGTTQVSASRL